jgi:hypothetical protein
MPNDKKGRSALICLQCSGSRKRRPTFLAGARKKSAGGFNVSTDEFLNLNEFQVQKNLKVGSRRVKKITLKEGCSESTVEPREPWWSRKREETVEQERATQRL